MANEGEIREREETRRVIKRMGWRALKRERRRMSDWASK